VPAIEVGGTHVSAALVDVRGGCIVAGTLRSLPLASDGTADEIVGRLLRCAEALEVRTAATWGVAIPGPFDYARGIGSFAGVAKFGSLKGVDLRARLLDGLGTRAASMRFVNDADAFLLGEWTSGAAAGHVRAAALTLGSGVGSAFLADGSIVEHGPLVPPEGRVDLLTIDGRPLEDTVSRRALLAAYAGATAERARRELDVLGLAELARQGSRPAGRVFGAALDALGRVLAPWLQRFGATVLVVGGSIARSWDVIEQPLLAGLERGAAGLTSHMELASARMPAEAPLIGAAAHVIARASGGR
jgi:glucokinase